MYVTKLIGVVVRAVASFSDRSGLDQIAVVGTILSIVSRLNCTLPRCSRNDGNTCVDGEQPYSDETIREMGSGHFLGSVVVGTSWQDNWHCTATSGQAVVAGRVGQRRVLKQLVRASHRLSNLHPALFVSPPLGLALLSQERVPLFFLPSLLPHAPHKRRSGSHGSPLDRCHSRSLRLCPGRP